ncbi:MAG: Uncharacterized protein Athens101410_101 [Parcubacteria group bacterium Athens1014_10]|nr:MAG: Uncharacterized protein Athens101410_101 [Parcubacteria group bacterium Athens1014_10]TSD05929.1 MAG: Uncharacterized protein Athens071412_211 [Parcubacteria group bacterium Athens0714_12]
MVNPFISKRVIFPPSEQKKFIIENKKTLDLSDEKLAYLLKINHRTLTNWKREKFSISLKAVKIILKKTDGKMPKNVEIKEAFWYANKGAKLGGLTVYKKYGKIGGDPEYRKKKWYEWWEKIGKFNPNEYFVAKKIVMPQKNTDLAEFIGIMIGDGGITKNQITVSLNYKTDKLYSIFVKNLIRKLFKINPSIYIRKNQSLTNIVVSRKRLVLFCKSLGLKIGDKLKQNLDIPQWIKKNKSFKIFCLRGLMDTDGCIFNECHKINEKKYCYHRLSFVSHSKQLRSSVFKILEELDFSPKIRNNRSVQLESRKDVIKYFNLISTNNPKHKKRFKYFLGGVGSGCPKRS